MPGEKSTLLEGLETSLGIKTRNQNPPATQPPVTPAPEKPAATPPEKSNDETSNNIKSEFSGIPQDIMDTLEPGTTVSAPQRPVKTTTDKSVQAAPQKPAASPDVPPETAKPATQVDPGKTTEAPAAAIPSEKDAKAFARLRIESEALKRELANRENRIQELEKTKADTTVVADLMKQLDEARDTIAQLDLSKDPRFTSRFDEPASRLIGQAQHMLKEMGESETMFEEGLSKPLKERIRFFQAQSPDLSGSLIALAAQVDGLKAQRDSELRNHSTASKTIQAQRQIDQERAKDQFFSGAVRELAVDHFALRHSATDTAWNEAVDGIASIAKQVLKGNDAMMQTKHIVLGAVAPVYLSMLRKEHALRVQLEGKLAAIVSASPHVGDGSGDTSQPAKQVTQDDKSKPMNAEEAARRVGEKLKLP